MEDDKLTENEDSPAIRPVFKILGLIVLGLAGLAVLALIVGGVKDAPKGTTNYTSPSMYSTPLAAPPPPESKESYVRSTKLIGTKKDSIYIKAFIKNPNKYKGERVKINVKVMDIHEQDGLSTMNVYLSQNMEVGVVAYNGSLDIYDGDIITVYGEVLGVIEGPNAMGATLTWPGIKAEYVKKIRSDDNDG